jgi:Cyclophilin type peptidyl-prolyl cis-trans isomerase/CLD
LLWRLTGVHGVALLARPAFFAIGHSRIAARAIAPMRLFPVERGGRSPPPPDRLPRDRAAVTRADVDAGQYNGGTFHRTVKMDNQPESPVKIEVIQAGVNPARAKDGFPPIAIERTSETGLRHIDGAISMARGQPDSATSGWFICINDQPSLDFGGGRNPDVNGSRRSVASSRGWTWCARFRARRTPTRSG